MKKVSIIIPVYNMEEWVESGIKCITEQTYENLEIIIIDDGSKDGSYMKCLAEADKDRRIAVFGKNNEGPGAARNLALRKATGDYIYFFDIDDYLEKNAIEKFVRYMENENTDLVVCSFSMFDGEKVFRTDRSENTSTTKEKDASGGERDAVSSQLEENTVFSQSAGQNTGNGPLIEKELYPQISGIVISAQGGDLPSVQAEISQAMEALFGLEPHKIKVLKRVE